MINAGIQHQLQLERRVAPDTVKLALDGAAEIHRDGRGHSRQGLRLR